MEGGEKTARGTIENGCLDQKRTRRREDFEMRIVVIGFGMMGRQIAQVFAQHGYKVTVTDENPAALKSGVEEIAHGPYGIEAAIAKAKINRDEGTKALREIQTTTDLEDACKDADLVIEAVYE